MTPTIHIPRLIFLDVDGVLNCNYTFSTMRQRGLVRPIEPDLLADVGQLVYDTGANVVISSAWRHFHSLSGLKQILRPHIDPRRILGVTPNDITRGREINAWLHEHGESAYRIAVLDDNDTGQFDMDPMRRWFVQTDEEYGVRQQDIRRATQLLTTGRMWTKADKKAA